MNEDSIRANLYQFFGAIIASSANGEAAFALIIEELTKLASTDKDYKHFNKELIKPMIKATHYIVTQQYNTLLEDSKKTFQDNIPKQIQDRLDNDKNLIDLLNSYIVQL